MSNISFVKNPSSVEGAVITEPSVATPAPSIPSTSLARIPDATLAPAYSENNIDFKNIIVPRLNVTQKVGGLSEVFNPGEIVLNQNTVVHIPDNMEKKITGSGPLVLVPIGCRPLQYAEKVSGGGRGLFFNTELEVAAANGTLDWKEWKASKATANPKKKFEEYATFLFLVKQPKVLLPDEEHQVFTHEIDGEYYALALFGLKGVWYTGFAKRMFSEKKIGFLKAGGYPSFNWNVSTFAKSFTGDDGEKHFAIAPIVSNGTRNTPALLSYVKDGLGFGS